MKTLRNIALLAGLTAAPAYAGGPTSFGPGDTTIRTTAEAPAPVNNAPVWAEGQETYTVTEEPVTFDLKATDADGDALTYTVPENWGQEAIDGGITVTYNGTEAVETAQFTVTDDKSEPVTLDVALQRAAPEAPVEAPVEPTAEPYALRKGFRLGPEYNFMSVNNGANYHTAGLRAAIDFPIENKNMLVSIIGGLGYANQGETRENQFSSGDEYIRDTESSYDHTTGGIYEMSETNTYATDETVSTWEEGRNGGYATLGANIEFGRKLRFNTGLEGSVLFGSFADERTDVTTTHVRQVKESQYYMNSEPAGDPTSTQADWVEINDDSSMYGNNVLGTLAIPARISYDAGNFNLSAGVAGGLMFNNGAQPYFSAGANATYRFGKKEE